MRTITRLIAGFGIFAALITFMIFLSENPYRENIFIMTSVTSIVLSTIIFCSLCFVACQAVDELIEIRTSLKSGLSENINSNKSNDKPLRNVAPSPIPQRHIPGCAWLHLIGAEVVVEGPRNGPWEGRILNFIPDPNLGWAVYLECPGDTICLWRDEITNISPKTHIL